MNTIQAVMEERLAALEGEVGALLVSNDQAVEAIAEHTIGVAGDHVVISPSLYGGTINLFLNMLAMTVSFVHNQDFHA